MVFRKNYGVAAVLIAASLLAACSSGSHFTPAFAPQARTFGGANFMFPDAAGITKIVWGTLPKAKAGTAIKKAVTIKITAKGKGGVTITGTYPKPIVISNPDKTGATKLFVNGKPATKSNPLKASTDTLTMTYSGLAISPVTFHAASGSVKSKAVFKPTIAAIVYTGPKVTGPEIDLTSNTAGQTGSEGTFTATQAGWTKAPYSKAFKYAFAAIGGQTNNCPGQAGNAYAITPGSGAKGTAFTVKGAGTAAAGECAMTITGGGGAKLVVTLTYTTTSVGINSEQR